MGMSPKQAWARCLAQFQAGKWVPDVTCVKGALTADTVVCMPCCQRLFASLLFHFRRAIPRDSLPPAVEKRGDCWHGMQCRTQKHNLVHAQNYNHVCMQVKRKE